MISGGQSQDQTWVPFYCDRCNSRFPVQYGGICKSCGQMVCRRCTQRRFLDDSVLCEDCEETYLLPGEEEKVPDGANPRDDRM